MKAIQKFRKDLKLTMPLLTNDGKGKAVSKQYGVVGTPTTYVVDRNGKVTAAILGADEKALKKALADLGIKI